MDNMAKPSYGQHFLTNKAIAQRQIRYAQLNTSDTVLEIGPGRGILTHLLAAHAKQVVAVEIDPKLCTTLRPHLPSNVTLLNNDILQIDLNTLPFFNKIVANLPFQISSPLTFTLINHHFERAVLMYQKDFAERMIASPKTSSYSRLSVAIYYYTHCTLNEIVPRSQFNPPPKVDAAIVTMIPRSTPPFHVLDENQYFQLVKDLFTYRRKKIKTVLSNKYAIHHPVLFGEKRAEELTPSQLATLSNSLI